MHSPEQGEGTGALKSIGARPKPSIALIGNAEGVGTVTGVALYPRPPGPTPGRSMNVTSSFCVAMALFWGAQVASQGAF